MDSNEYEVTDSEDEYSKEEKILLEDARRLMRKKEASSDVSFSHIKVVFSILFLAQNERVTLHVFILFLLGRSLRV